MAKKIIVTLLAFLLILSIALMAGLQERQKATPLDDFMVIQEPSSRAPCSIVKTNGGAAYWWSRYEAGTGTYTYFDPDIECGAPTYPFEITDFSFTLYDNGGSYTWPAMVDIVVYELSPTGNPCDGPGAEKCRYSLSADAASYGYPTVGTYTFPDVCCVDGPFFIGLEYQQGNIENTPTVLYDSQNPTDCDNWYLDTDGLYYEWSDFWGPSPPGYPLFWVDGETVSANCQQGCTWNPGDTHKMHFPQLPDEAGWDVNATQPMILADDFMCMQDGPITDVHWWGSWKHGNEGQIVSFWLSIHADIPADQNPTGYSMPGVTLWEREVTDFDAIPKDPPSMEGWYDPATGEVIWDDHQAYFQYNVCFDPGDPDLFIQDSGTIYWLNITAIVADPVDTKWGWKSTRDHWNDDAVWGFWGELDWIDIWEPSIPLQNAFFIDMDPFGNFMGGGGENHYGDGWYYYPQYDWWNIWFYDHPFAPERYKEGFILFDIFPWDPGQPMYVEVAVNWSTDLWSIDFPGDSMPPLPGVPEDLYIGREILWATQFWEGPVEPLPFVIPDYNPEWVSVDVRGFNFVIPAGVIEHDCRGSLDLAFVITQSAPPDSGACCYDPTGGPDESDCIYTTQTHCEQMLGGFYQGNGIPCQGVQACCLPNGDCVMADVLCCVNELGGVPQGPGSQCTAPQACCFPDNTCAMIDPICCDDHGGIPQGPGSSCLGMQACCMPDGSCLMMDGQCCFYEGGTPQGPGTVCSAVEACCFPDNTCRMLDPLCCYDEGGIPQGPGSSCLGMEACCLPAGPCQMMDALCCINHGGVPQGPGTVCTAYEACCLPNGSCQMLDPLCCDDQGGVPQGPGSQCTAPQACCFPDNTCAMIDPICCDDHGGIPQGQGSSCQGMQACCLPDGSCQVMDGQCCLYQGGIPQGNGTVCSALEACCFPDNTCRMLDPLCCVDEGGIPQGPGSSCLGMEACCLPAGPCQMMDALCCINHGGVPQGPGTVCTAVEACCLPNGSCQMLDPLCCDDQGGVPQGPGSQCTAPQACCFPDNTCAMIDPICCDDHGGIPQGSGSSCQGLQACCLPDGSCQIMDGQCCLYQGGTPQGNGTVCTGPEVCCFQDGSCLNLDPLCCADLGGTSSPIGAPGCMGDANQNGVDDACEEFCDCIPGDANGDGAVNVGDAVYIISYVFKGGPPPTPYATCSGDANCDCTVNVGDAVYVIAYVFKGGPPPCDCTGPNPPWWGIGWLEICGPPLRK
jgi:hypothetical protein